MIEIISAIFYATNGDQYDVTKILGFWRIKVTYYANNKIQESRYSYPTFDSAKNHCAIHHDSGVWIDPIK